jgi:hypothetical protein
MGAVSNADAWIGYIDGAIRSGARAAQDVGRCSEALRDIYVLAPSASAKAHVDHESAHDHAADAQERVVIKEKV